MPITNEPHLYSCTSQWSPGRPYIRNRRIEHPEIPDCASRFLPVLAPRPPTAPGYTAPGTATPFTVSAQLQDLRAEISRHEDRASADTPVTLYILALTTLGIHRHRPRSSQSSPAHAPPLTLSPSVHSSSRSPPESALCLKVRSF